MLMGFENGMTEKDMQNYIKTMLPGISYSDMWSIRNRFVYDLVPLDKAVEEYYENNHEKFVETADICEENKYEIIEETWEDFDGGETMALSIDKEGQYTISEFIQLLKEAQKKFGDKKIYIHDMNANAIGGFSHVYLHHGYDEREKYGEEYCEDDSICIYG